MDVSLSAARTATATDAERAGAVTSTLDGILFREILAPLAAALGPAGDALFGRVVNALVVRPKP